MRDLRRRRSGLVAAALLALSVAAPAVALANSVHASASCTWTTGNVGQDERQAGQIDYFASDWWLPKTAYYTTVWEWLPFTQPVVTSGDAPRGAWYHGTDPNFGHSVWRQDGSFTVWGDATKFANTKAFAEIAKSSSLVGTTTGAGHALDDWEKCHNGTGWVTVNP